MRIDLCTEGLAYNGEILMAGRQGVDALRRSLFIFLMTLPVVRFADNRMAAAASGWILHERDN